MIWIETQASILMVIFFFLICLWVTAEYYRYYLSVRARADEVIKNTDIDKLSGTAGIAHSRYNVWAPKSPRYNTPGASHPWIDDAGKIALMHNGEIKNNRKHFERLRTNHDFQSYIEEFDYITDSEVAVHLIGDEISNGASVEEALRTVTPKLTGQFLLGIVHIEHPDTVWIAN